MDGFVHSMLLARYVMLWFIKDMACIHTNRIKIKAENNSMHGRHE